MNTPPEQPAQTTNRLAIASLVLGIIAIIPGSFLFWGLEIFTGVPYANQIMVLVFMLSGVPLGLAGVYTGTYALRQIKNNGEYEKVKVIALAGIVLGVLNCVLGGCNFLFWRIFWILGI